MNQGFNRINYQSSHFLISNNTLSWYVNVQFKLHAISVFAKCQSWHNSTWQQLMFIKRDSQFENLDIRMLSSPTVMSSAGGGSYIEFMVVGKVVLLSYMYICTSVRLLCIFILTPKNMQIYIWTRRVWSNKNILMLTRTRVLKNESNNSFGFRQSTKVQSTCRPCSKIA